MSTGTGIALIAILAVSACTLAGVFLTLRRMAMMADAISHSVLPGLVAGYFLARGPSMLAGFLGATAAGLVTVFLVEALTRSRRVREDSAIGIVFPALFALGVFIVSRYFANVHLDADAVLMGNIEWATLDSLIVGGRDLGPMAAWILGALTLVNAAFLLLFYKELKLSTFDPQLAAALGLVPGVLHYALMAIVAITTVGAFNAVGAIMTVGLVIVPPVTASLLTRRLPLLIALALGVGIVAAVSGTWLAILWNVQISGMIATMLGVLFALALLLAPQQGIVAQTLRHRRQRQQFAMEMLVVHLATHEGTAAQAEESDPAHLERELHWTSRAARRAIERGTGSGLIVRGEEGLELTEEGRRRAEDVSAR